MIFICGVKVAHKRNVRKYLWRKNEISFYFFLYLKINKITSKSLVTAKLFPGSWDYVESRRKEFKQVKNIVRVFSIFLENFRAFRQFDNDFSEGFLILKCSRKINSFLEIPEYKCLLLESIPLFQYLTKLLFITSIKTQLYGIRYRLLIFGNCKLFLLLILIRIFFSSPQSKCFSFLESIMCRTKKILYYEANAWQIEILYFYFRFLIFVFSLKKS